MRNIGSLPVFLNHSKSVQVCTEDTTAGVVILAAEGVVLLEALASADAPLRRPCCSPACRGVFRSGQCRHIFAAETFSSDSMAYQPPRD